MITAIKVSGGKEDDAERNCWIFDMLNNTTIAAFLETAGALAKIASTLAQLAADAGRQSPVPPATPSRARRPTQ